MRRSGRTTRIIDSAVQELFTKGKVTLTDHHFGEPGSMYNPKEANKRATRYAFDTLIKRLNSEHGNWTKFTIDRDKFSVSIKTLQIATFDVDSWAAKDHSLKEVNEYRMAFGCPPLTESEYTKKRENVKAICLKIDAMK